VLEGALIAESLRDGTTLDGIRLVVRKITRHTPGGTTADQPATWTIIDFEATKPTADGIAQALAGVLDQPGWYADFRSDTETFVVFPGRVFRYHAGTRRRGQPRRRTAANSAFLNPSSTGQSDADDLWGRRGPRLH